MSRLNAILLGRLQMTIDDCIAISRHLYSIFQHTSRLSVDILGKLRPSLPRKNASLFEHAVLELLHAQGLARDTPFTFDGVSTYVRFPQTVVL
jgi:hypothetical protein